jgi:hypothetical protein
VRLLARWFLLLAGAAAYRQYGQDEHYQERLRAACADKGGKLTLTNLCINIKPMLDELIASKARRTRLVNKRACRGADVTGP